MGEHIVESGDCGGSAGDLIGRKNQQYCLLYLWPSKPIVKRHWRKRDYVNAIKHNYAFIT